MEFFEFITTFQQARVHFPVFKKQPYVGSPRAQQHILLWAPELRSLQPTWGRPLLPSPGASLTTAGSGDEALLCAVVGDPLTADPTALTVPSGVPGWQQFYKCISSSKKKCLFGPKFNFVGNLACFYHFCFYLELALWYFQCFSDIEML